MSTDALREKVAREIWRKWSLNHFDDGEWLIEQVKAALAAPASETEKLPAKWRERYVKHHRGDEECCCCSMCAIELEAALKADRQGG